MLQPVLQETEAHADPRPGSAREQDHASHVIESVLEFMYKASYGYPDDVHKRYEESYDQLFGGLPPGLNAHELVAGRMLLDIDVFIAAGKFFIPKLKDMAATTLAMRCNSGGWASRDFAAAISKVFAMPSGIHTELKRPILAAAVENAQDLLSNEFKYPAFHSAMRFSADFGTAVAIKVAMKPPQKVIVDKVVERVVHRPVDRPVDRYIYINDPAMRKFCCPHCGQVFSIGPTPTARTEFGCPRAVVRETVFGVKVRTGGLNMLWPKITSRRGMWSGSAKDAEKRRMLQVTSGSFERVSGE